MRRRVPLGIAALAGGAMVLAHWIAYLVAVPDSHSRAHVLATTGHGRWLYVAAAGLAAGVFGVSAFVRSRLAEGRDVPGVTARLAVMQVLGFLALEVTERIASGHAFSEVLNEPVIAIGVIAQLVVALVGAALLRGVVRVLARIRAARPTPVASPSISYAAFPSVSVPPVALAAGGLGLRGPPVRVR